MADTALVAHVLTPNSGVSNAATLATGALAPTGVTFSNTGHELLFVAAGTSPGNASVEIGTTVLGQPVTALSVALIASATNVLGPFSSQLDAPGSSTVRVEFATAPTSVGLVQVPGVS